MTQATYTFDENIFSDLYKEVNGFRPRQHEFYEASDERKQEIWNALIVELEEVSAAFELKRNESEKAFEENVASRMVDGVSREGAITSIVEELKLDKYDLAYGGNYITYLLNLPDAFEKELDAIANKLRSKLA